MRTIYRYTAKRGSVGNAHLNNFSTYDKVEMARHIKSTTHIPAAEIEAAMDEAGLDGFASISVYDLVSALKPIRFRVTPDSEEAE